MWGGLFRLAGVQLRMSSAFHPQTDRQSKVVNKIITMYLCCTSSDHPRDWLDWMPWVEFCNNSPFHSALRTSPFQVVYGRPPLSLLSYEHGTADTIAVDDMLARRDEFLAAFRERLLQA